MAESKIKRPAVAEYVTLGSADSSIDDSAGYLVFNPTSRTVRVYGYARSSGIISGTTSMGTIPEAYRPTSNYPGTAMITLGDGTIVPYACVFNTNGKITQDLTGSAKSAMFVGEYVI